LIPVGVLAQKIKNLNSGDATNEMQNFDSTMSKNQLNLQKPEESVEQSLKKEEDKK